MTSFAPTIVCVACWFVTVLVVVGGCKDPMKPGPPNHGHDHAHAEHAHGTFANAETWSTKLDDPTRDEWQLPDEVLRALALTPSMIVADVGAGTGYFAIRI